jgi:hypothetical protein
MTDKTSAFTISAAPHWKEVAPVQGVRTFRHDGGKRTTMQVSLLRRPLLAGSALNKRGIAAEMAMERGAKIISGAEGTCAVGTWGRVVYEMPGLAHGENWILTDGLDVLLATYTTETKPSQKDLDDVARMVQSVHWTKRT